MRSRQSGYFVSRAVWKRRCAIVRRGQEQGRWSELGAGVAIRCAERATIPATDAAWERFVDYVAHLADQLFATSPMH
jgi:hypothetical protein